MSTSTRRDPVTRTAQIVRLLKARPRTSKELAQAMGISKDASDRYLRELRGTRAHIVDWPRIRDGVAWHHVALWAAGPGKDALRPPPRHRHAADYDMDNPGDRLETKRAESVRQAQALAAELRKLPARNPLEACVSAALYAEHRGTA